MGRNAISTSGYYWKYVNDRVVLNFSLSAYTM